MQGVLQQEILGKPVLADAPDNRMKKIGFLSSIFGCWHKRLTRPISDAVSTYQTCVECGARRQVDAENFKAFGPFYYPAEVRLEDSLAA